MPTSRPPAAVANAGRAESDPAWPDLFPGSLSQHAVELLPIGVIFIRPDGLISAVNRQVEHQFGYTRSELIGQPFEFLLPGGLHAADTLEREACLSGRHKSGQMLPVQVRLDPLHTQPPGFVLASILDNTDRERQQTEHRRAIDRAVEFDTLVGEISASFVNLGTDRVDEAIIDAQRRVVEALHLDRSTVFQLSEDGQDLVLTHFWSRPGMPTPGSTMRTGAEFPWSLPKILAGERVCFSSPDEVPDAKERETLQKFATKSRVAFPLYVDGLVKGAIGFSSRENRSWEPATLERLGLVARVFGSVLARKQAHGALVASEQRFRAFADSSPAMMWACGPDKVCTWFNRQWLEFVGLPIERAIRAGLTERVYPDDLDAYLRVYQSSFDARRPFSIEYRALRRDGEWRWLLDNGTPNYGAEGVFAGYIGSCIDITDHRNALREVERLRDELHAENVVLRHEVTDRHGSPHIVGEGEAIRRTMLQIQQVAPTDSTVLLIGETGTGKELLATQIHELSARSARMMVRVNCAAIPSTIIESELFGREKGAFTGALTRQVGRFELADRSTIFLDEIGDLPAEVQIKLLRVLEERQIERLGSAKSIRVDTRIIAATHRNLEQLVAQGTFREDLFYRLNVFPIHVPPLRERVEDIPLLVWRFVDEFAKALGSRIEAIPRENMETLQRYPWPGNIRELRNLVERAMIVTKGSRLVIPVPTAVPAGRRSVKLTDVEREHIRAVLETSGWRIRGPGGAAERLGLRPTTLETRMAKLGLTRPKSTK